MIINHNIISIYAHRQSKINTLATDKTLEKLASGLAINRAADNAAGLAVSEKMRAQIRGLRQAERNAMDGISFIQTTEGYLAGMQDTIHRIRELAIQASNGIYTNDDRHKIQVEVSQLVDEVDRIASHAQFNTLNMLTGRYAPTDATQTGTASMWFHIGANMDQREKMHIATMTALALGLKEQGTDKILSLSTPDNANRSIATLDEALGKISQQRANMGAFQNRLEFAVRGISIGYENLQASESRIRDTDMAEQSIKLATNQILSQSAIAMLAQSNMRPQLVLQLLR